jgi:hypothetical protein
MDANRRPHRSNPPVFLRAEIWGGTENDRGAAFDLRSSPLIFALKPAPTQNVIVTMDENRKSLVFKFGTLFYAATAAGWLICWVPFGFGYYGLPWMSRSFRSAALLLATLHLIVGMRLLAVSVKRKRLRIVTILAVGMSGLALVAMIDWISRYVTALNGF